MSEFWFILRTARDSIAWSLLGLSLQFGFGRTHCLVSSEARAVGSLDCLHTLLEPGGRDGAAAGSSCRLEDGVVIDPWHRPLRVTYADGGQEIRSAGKDGRFATSDDIVGYYRPSSPPHFDVAGHEFNLTST
jgi:hypothetical protein